MPENTRAAASDYSTAAALSIATPNHIIGADDQERNVTRLVNALEARGFKVHRVEAGWLVCRWAALSKLCPGERELASFAKQVGAA